MKNENSALALSRGESSDRIHSLARSLLGDITQKSVLDLGCGTGIFLESLSKQGAKELVGCDGMDFRTTPGAFRFELSDLNKKLPFADGSFDRVTAIEVIEHLENPRFFAREVARVLKPGGFALFSTPNNESFTSLISLFFRGYFAAFGPKDYPAHISPVLELDFQRILKESGLESGNSIWTNWGRIPALPLHWQEVLGPLLSGRRFSDNYFCLGKK